MHRKSHAKLQSLLTLKTPRITLTPELPTWLLQAIHHLIKAIFFLKIWDSLHLQLSYSAGTKNRPCCLFLWPINLVCLSYTQSHLGKHLFEITKSTTMLWPTQATQHCFCIYGSGPIFIKLLRKWKIKEILNPW